MPAAHRAALSASARRTLRHPRRESLEPSPSVRSEEPGGAFDPGTPGSLRHFIGEAEDRFHDSGQLVIPDPIRFVGGLVIVRMNPGEEFNDRNVEAAEMIRVSEVGNLP